MRRLAVFCGSRSGEDASFAAATRQLARALASAQITLVYGGARIGLMGILADELLHAGGQAIGVLPRSFLHSEGAHPGLTELRIVDSIQERKVVEFNLSDGFIALPGGIGTMEELFDVLNSAQNGSHSKPCGVLNVAGYYTRLLDLLDHMLHCGFIRQHQRAMVLDSRTPEALLAQFLAYQRPPST